MNDQVTDVYSDIRLLNFRPLLIMVRTFVVTSH